MAETTVAWNVDSNLVDEVIYQFEKAFKEGKNPTPDDYLKGEGLTRWRLLMELLHSDLELRLRAGQSITVANYLARYPELAKFPNEVIVLLETEIRLLKQAGKQPDAQTYEEQFGSMLGGRVKDLFSRVRGSLPVIPGYDILDTIGHGGMGVVYRARHLLLNREVALKLIRPEKMRDEATTASFKARFRREAESVASINHPNVVQIYETGDYDGTLFLAMELVKGQSLQKHIDTNGVMSPQAAAGMFIKLAMGLQAVHDKQIIHRDLKPENILLNELQEPKISDFGLARPLEGASHETAAGTPVGTPAYMSPEQASLKDEKITPLVDVYGLGATLYCALTGHAPFPRESLLVTLEKVRTENVLPIRDQRKEVPLDLETICLKCLNKEPGKRYSDAKVLAEELRRFGNNEPIHARPVGRVEKTWRWCKRHPMVAGLTAGIAAVLLAATAITSLLSWWALNEKDRADGNASSAQQKAEEALKEKQRAERLLALQANREGLRAMENGDRYVGMLWFAQPLVLGAGQEDEQHISRVRLGLIANTEHRRTHLLGILQHSNAVTRAYFSPDGQSILTCSWDKTARIWDTQSGKPLTDPLVHPKEVMNVAFSPTGHVIATASDKMAQLWEIKNGQKLLVRILHKDQINHICFSVDGKYFMTCSSDRTAQIWDSLTGKAVTEPLRHLSVVRYGCFSPDGRFVATASLDKTAKIWDVQSGKSISNPVPHTGAVFHISISPDSRSLVTASEDKTAKVVDIRNGHDLFPALKHTAMISQANYSPDGRYIITASNDATAQIWDAQTGRPVGPTLKHQDSVLQANFSPDGRYVVTCSSDNTARIWNVRTRLPTTPPLNHQRPVTQCNFSPSGRYLITSSLDKTARIWDARSSEQLSIPVAFQGTLFKFRQSPDARYEVKISGKVAQILDIQSGQLQNKPLVHDYNISHASFSPDSKYLVTTTLGVGTARIWDVKTGQLVGKPMVHQSILNEAQFSSDGRYLATLSGPVVSVWDVKSSKLLITPIEHSAYVYQVNFSPDLRYVVTASRDQTSRIWDIQRNLAVSQPLYHQNEVYKASFSSDGEFVITITRDKTVRVWNAKSGQAVSPPIPHIDNVWQAITSLDSRLLATLTPKSIQIWNLRTGQAISPSLNHPRATHLVFNMAQNHLVSSTQEMKSLGWRLDPETRPVDEIIKLSQIQANQKIDDTGGLQPLDIEKELIPWYHEMKAKYPEEFIPKYEDTRRWRLQQIADCCKERNLPAAFFHHNWLLAEAVLEASKVSK